ncbi:hypothetical protein V5O48_004990 [Marasmius crinis-equi]|uniref:Mitochondrial splicing suppressor 51-like C-terminal domain-containing protein n=1 Tax=Marasmius crinis-equi TaxID=585013 RepID=A0ABR3FNL6_9AGAR
MRADWKAHKMICNALTNLGKDESSKKMLTSVLPNTARSDTRVVNDICQRSNAKEVELLTANLGRALNRDERDISRWQPRCMGCSRTDRLIRIENTEDKVIKPCDACKTSFYCCEKHWERVSEQHTTKPAQDGPGNLTQCQINKQFRTDVLFDNLMSDAHDCGPGKSYIFQWAPERHLAGWKPLKAGDKCWEEDFDAPLQKEFGSGSTSSPATLAPFLRGATEGLSMPMTILYALQNLESSDDWTRKRSLTVHLLGAHEKEVNHLQMFDEILHRLPVLKKLRLVMIGPQLANGSDPEETMPCLDCVQNSKQRTHEIHAMSYHEYVKKQGSKYAKPDLAVAFNSSASETPSFWKETMKILVAKKVATVFTAYNREEAKDEAQLLRDAGATLVPALGPVKNPWGSLKLIPEPNRVTGFYATNGWLAGGFCS